MSISIRKSQKFNNTGVENPEVHPRVEVSTVLFCYIGTLVPITLLTFDPRICF